MKRLLLSAAIFIAGTPLFAQNSFQILDPGGNNVTDQTIDLWYDQTYSVYAADFDVKNVSGSTKRVMAKRHRVLLNSPAYELFCWVLCYSPNTSVSPTAALMPDNSTHLFSSHYYPNSTDGMSTIVYTFYDSLNMADSSRFTINWHITPTSVKDIAPASGIISAVYPNPANANTTINYSLNNADNAFIKIYDILGNQVRNVAVDPKEGTVNLNVAELKAGIYFCSLIADEKSISTQKLTIVK